MPGAVSFVAEPFALPLTRYEGPERVPGHVENPDYGIYPCEHDFHATYQDEEGLYLDRCPECGNQWWSVDGTECPEDWALIAEIDRLRSEVMIRATRTQPFEEDSRERAEPSALR